MTWNAQASEDVKPPQTHPPLLEFAGLAEAEAVLADLAQVFFQNSPPHTGTPVPNLEARYRVLLDRFPPSCSWLTSTKAWAKPT
jgi:hypothetical protein